MAPSSPDHTSPFTQMWADAVYEWRTSRTPVARLSAAVSALAAVTRLLLTWIPYGGLPMRNLFLDYRFAWRRLRDAPLFTVFAISTLALGIGITTGVYSAVRAVLTPPGGLAQPDRLVQVTRSEQGSGPMMSLSWPEYQDFLTQQSVFDSIAAWHFRRASISVEGRTEPGNMELVSGAYFATLGVTAERGRTLTATDDTAEASAVAVISHDAWRRWFDASPDVVGRVIKFSGAPVTIVGVAHPEFKGLFNGGVIPTAVWLTFSVARSMPNMETAASFDQNVRDQRWLSIMGRLGPDRAIEQARAQVAAIGTRLNEAFPEEDDRWARPRPWSARRLTDVPKLLGTGQVLGPLTTTLMVSVGLVLLVACTNIANLMLSRVSGRAQEFAVRLSLGASRWRVVREAVAEAVIIAVAGGAVAIGIARLLIVLLGQELTFTRGIVLQLEPRLDLAVLTVATLATFLAMLVAGLAPALHAGRADIRRALASDNASTVSPRWRGRRYLITVQVTVSVLLVAIAALCTAQVSAHQQLNTGIDFASLALVDVDFKHPQYDQATVQRLVETVLREANRQPGVTAVSASSGLPSGITTPGASVRASGPVQWVDMVAGTPALFETLGIAIVRGRGIDARDVAGSVPIVVLGEQTANALFGSIDVLGRTVRVKRRQWVGDPEWPERALTVVGVAESAGRQGQARSGTVYLPSTQQHETQLVFAARSTGDVASLVKSMREIVQKAAPDAAVTQSLTGSDLLAQDTLFFQVVAVISSVLGTMALIVALVGLYGILSFLVASRTREIGIRMAIGAEASTISRQILREGLSPILLGLILGLGLATLGRLGMQPLFERMMPAMDLVALVAVPILFLVAGSIACYWPARRAARVDPNIALRTL